MSDAVADLIDLARYPVHRLAHQDGRALAEHCRGELAATGSCLLPGFITDAAVARMAGEAALVAPLAWRKLPGPGGTAYLAPPDESFPEAHPKRRRQTSSLGAVAYDLIPKSHAIRAVYEWDGLLDFLAVTSGLPRLYRYADPMGGLNIAVMTTGDHLLWHFDQTDFVVSILLQECDSGGAFEYVPHIRSAEEPHYDRVWRLLDGARDGVVTLAMKPGTLALFMGRYSIHRVTEIAGATPRLIALLGYDTKPGTMSSDHLRLGRYGRTEPVA
jgi:hypothetical protein